MIFTPEQRSAARGPIVSLIGKSERARERVEAGSWQHRMLGENLHALAVASDLLDAEPGDKCRWNREDLHKAGEAIAAMIRKTSPEKFAAGTSQHSLLKNRLAALQMAGALIEERAASGS